LVEPIEAAYERGEIGVAEWHRRIGAIIGPAYFAYGQTNARGGGVKVWPWLAFRVDAVDFPRRH